MEQLSFRSGDFLMDVAAQSGDDAKGGATRQVPAILEAGRGATLT